MKKKNSLIKVFYFRRSNLFHIFLKKEQKKILSKTICKKKN